MQFALRMLFLLDKLQQTVLTSDATMAEEEDISNTSDIPGRYGNFLSEEEPKKNAYQSRDPMRGSSLFQVISLPTPLSSPVIKDDKNKGKEPITLKSFLQGHSPSELKQLEDDAIKSGYTTLLEEVSQDIKTIAQALQINTGKLPAPELDLSILFNSFLERKEEKLITDYHNHLDSLIKLLSAEDTISSFEPHGWGQRRQTLLKAICDLLQEKIPPQDKIISKQPPAKDTYFFSTHDIQMLCLPLEGKIHCFTPLHITEIIDSLNTVNKNETDKNAFITETEHKIICFPLHNGGAHWLLLALSADRQTLACFDSLHATLAETPWIRDLQETLGVFFKTEANPSIKIKLNNRLQTDGVNCVTAQASTLLQ